MRSIKYFMILTALLAALSGYKGIFNINKSEALSSFRSSLISIDTTKELNQPGTHDVPSVSSLLSSLPVRCLGPGTLGLRISDIAVYENDSRIFYIASANGGVLKTVDGGKTCSFVFDKEGASNIGAVTVSQKNPDIVWVGTGEGWQRNSVGWGDGIYKSIDGGKTWMNMGLPNSNSFSKILIHPKNNDIVFAAVLGSAWGYGPDRGIYKTIDGGKSWKKILYVNEQTAAADIVMDPKNPNNLLAGMWDHIHRPYGFTSGGVGSGIYRSTDCGNTWHKVTNGLPKKDVGRIALDYFRKDPRHVVAVVEEALPGSSFYRSMDGGESWVQMPAIHYDKNGNKETNPGNTWYRPYYNNVVRFNTRDVNTIYYGNPWHYTINGGKTFFGAAGDDHALWIDPNNSLHYIHGSDGGVHQNWDLDKISQNGYRHKTENVNLPPLDQVYGVGYDMRKLYWVIGNMQDGNAWSIPTQTKTGCVSELDADWIGGSEGGYSMADPEDWTTVYAQGPGMLIDRMDLKTGLRKRLFNDNGIPEYVHHESFNDYMKMNPRLRAGWNPGFQLSPWNSKTLYFGANFLFKSVDRGDNWKIISPDLTHDKAEWQVPDHVIYQRNEIGTNRTYQTITTICESSLKQGLIWVGTDDGYVQLTKDDGKTWTNLTKNILDLPEYSWVSHIYSSRHVEGRAYVTFDGHRNQDMNTYVYVTEDYGKTWSKINNNLPEKEACHVIIEGLKNPDLLFLGTEFSLWVSIDRGKTWNRYQDWSKNKYYEGYFPTVAVRDLQIHPRELDLIIGTHGRGIWVLPIRALEELTVENRNKDVYFIKPGNMYLFPNVKKEKDMRTNLKFQSFNTQPGTLFCYYLRENAKAGATIKIIDNSGYEVIGQKGSVIKGSATAGLNTITWSFPNGNPPIKRPGDYRVVLSIDGKDYFQVLHVEDATGEVIPNVPQTSYPENVRYKPDNSR